ncbi:MAG TPA: hypothetical protein VEP73_02455 [Actinomycetota bacterium]|nr:hypothetical protein [Actinomycetota bacterium]
MAFGLRGKERAKWDPELLDAPGKFYLQARLQGLTGPRSARGFWIPTEQALQTYGHVIPGMDRDAAATVADLILRGTQKGSGTVVPDPSANKTASNGPPSDTPGKEVKDERPAQ